MNNINKTKGQESNNQKTEEITNAILYEQCDLLAKFNKIPFDLTERIYDHAKTITNIKKNNFMDVLPSQETCVRLSKIPEQSSDFINANWIFDKYIATQQPNNFTIIDFWRMVFETRAPIICNLNGNDNYLPDNSQNIFNKSIQSNQVINPINIKIENEIKKKNYTVRKICLSLYTVSHFLTHITFYAWPDRSVPEFDDFKNLFDIVELKTFCVNISKESPMIVHCKAGVGRTGTFILIHHIMFLLERKEPFNIIKLIKNMRTSRTSMVQGEIQFKFVLKFLATKIITNNSIGKLNLTSSLDSSFVCDNFAHNKFNKKFLTMSSGIMSH